MGNEREGGGPSFELVIARDLWRADRALAVLNLVVDKTRCDEVTRCRAPEQRSEYKRGFAIRSAK